MNLVKQDHEIEEAAKLRQKRQAKSLKDLASKANNSASAFEKKMESMKGSASGDISMIPKSEREASRKAFFKEFKRVVEDSDVILEVLDARDPLGCRAREVEQAILEKGNKKIILVLNKIDLVPREVVSAWLKALRHEFPTVAFRCNTQSQKSHLTRNKGDFDTMDSLTGGGGCIGGDNLLELLKNYSRSLNMKTSITVGIIGYPNTGKSSLINSLKRSRAAAVGAKPGHTKTMQEIKLDTNVKLLDCPGIVFSAGDGDEHDSADIVLRNAVEMEKIPDPVSVIDAVLRRCPRERLMELYEIPAYKSGEQFLAFIAQKIGKLKKGGVPDYKAAAVSVLRDWQSGKIRFYTMPPERTEKVMSSKVVTQWAKEFNLDSILQKEEEDVAVHVPSVKAMDRSIQVSSAGSRTAYLGEEEEEMDVDDDEEEEEEEEDDEQDRDMMDLSDDVLSDSEDEFAKTVETKKGTMMVTVEQPKKTQEEKKKKKKNKRGVEGEVAEEGRKEMEVEDMAPALSRAQKKKRAKNKKKKEEKEDYESAPFDFDQFSIVKESNKNVEDDDDDDFNFAY